MILSDFMMLNLTDRQTDSQRELERGVIEFVRKSCLMHVLFIVSIKKKIACEHRLLIVKRSVRAF